MQLMEIIDLFVGVWRAWFEIPLSFWGILASLWSCPSHQLVPMSYPGVIEKTIPIPLKGMKHAPSRTHDGIAAAVDRHIAAC
jgi:hypothetical protein